MDRFNLEIDANHKSKCRICLKQSVDIEQQIIITQLIEKQFFEVTQRELYTSEDLSHSICHLCKSQLTECCQFKENAIEFQEKLLKFTNTIVEMKFKEEPHWEESTVIDSGLVNVSIKTESDEYLFADPFSPKIEDSDPEPSSSKLSPREPSFSQCQECNKTIQSNKLNRHIQRCHRKSKTFFCDLCGHGTSTKNFLAVHITSHVLGRKAKELFKCDQCEFATVTPMALHNHKRRAHLNEISTKRLHKCKHCDAIFDNYWSKESHNKKAHGIPKTRKSQERFNCKFCPMDFKYRHSLRFHQFRKHPTEMADMPEEKEDKKLICAECNFETLDKEQMKGHMMTHSDDLTSDKPICSCNQCGMTYIDEKKLYQHKHEHYMAKQRRLCDLCGKSCRSKTDLSFHRKSAHGEKDIPCHFCGKLFATDASLKIHFKQHKERRYVCDHSGCDKAFIQAAVFRDHLKTHSGIRDCVCEICATAFFSQSRLHSHMKNVHSGLSFSCELCSNIYTRYESLRNHLKKHHSDKTPEEVKQLVTRAKARNK